ncbi:hypothetical protein, partial [Methanococcoides seepicolus]
MSCKKDRVKTERACGLVNNSSRNGAGSSVRKGGVVHYFDQIQTISTTLKTTIPANTRSSGNMLMSRDAETDLFQYLDADSISFADSKNISATTASTPYSG